MVQSDLVRKEFALRLAQACKNKGLDDHGRGMAIARALNVSSKGVSKWLNAEALPRQDKINALADFLGVNVVWLQHGEGAGDIDAEKHRSLSKRQEILLALFNDLPDSDADALLKSLEDKKRYYDELYKELNKKRRDKAS